MTAILPRYSQFLISILVGLFALSAAVAQDLDFGLDGPDPGKEAKEDDDLSELTGEKKEKKLPENLFFYAPFDETFDAVQGGKDCFSSMTSVKAVYEDAPVGKGVVIKQTVSYPEEKGFPLRSGTMAFWLKPQDPSFMIFGKLTRREPARGDLNSMRIGYGTFDREKSVPVFDVMTTDCEGFAGRSGLQADMPIWKPGMWKHVAIVWSRAGFQIWIDGKKLAEFDEGAYTPDENAKSFDLNPYGRDTFTIDDFRIYSTKLREDEIKALVAMGDRKVIKAAQLRAAKNIGGRCIVFFDRRFIHDLRGAELALHHPRPAEVALRLDKPWEGPLGFGFNVFRHEGKFRLYYRTAGAAPESMVMCGAESEDGIRWTKPNYGAADHNGTRNNNLIADVEGHAIPNLHIFLDSGPEQTSGKVKGFYFKEAKTFRDFLPTERGLLRAVFLASHDGTVFQRMSTQPRLLCSGRDPAGTFATMFWSAAEKAYVCTSRTWNKVYTLTRMSSTDFLHWYRPRGSIGFGSGDPWHLWINGMMPYPRDPEVYVSLAGRMLPGGGALTQEQIQALGISADTNLALWEDRSDCVFMTAEPGSMLCNREFAEPLVPPGPEPANSILGCNLPVPGLIDTGPDEYSFFVSRQFAQPGWHLQRFVIRKDGFVSVRAGTEGGTLITKPLRFTGDQLELNCAVADAGHLKVAIEDATEDGKIIPGFSADECEPLTGDGLNQVVRWKGGKSVAELAEGTAIHLHFIMKEADLYSFRFTTKGKVEPE